MTRDNALPILDPLAVASQEPEAPCSPGARRIEPGVFVLFASASLALCIILHTLPIESISFLEGQLARLKIPLVPTRPRLDSRELELYYMSDILV